MKSTGPCLRPVVQEIALAIIVDQAHNYTFSRAEATPARTHGEAAVGYAMRLAMKTFSQAILRAHRIASALLLSGFVLCNFGAQADVFYSKIGGWSVVYR